MDNIVIVGSSGHSKVIVDILVKNKEYNIVGFIDDFREVNETTLDIPVIGTESDLPMLIEEHKLVGIVIAIGDNFVRQIVANKIKETSPSLQFISAIHPSAIISNNVKIGNGVVIMAGAIINSSVTIGNFCILNTNSSIDHDSKMLNFSSLAPNVSTGGDCFIGKMSSLGIGTILKHGVKIGNNSVVGAGSLVLRDIKSNVVAYGVPAKIIRKREEGEHYL